MEELPSVAKWRNRGVATLRRIRALVFSMLALALLVFVTMAVYTTSWKDSDDGLAFQQRFCEFRGNDPVFTSDGGDVRYVGCRTVMGDYGATCVENSQCRGFCVPTPRHESSRTLAEYFEIDQAGNICGTCSRYERIECEGGTLPAPTSGPAKDAVGSCAKFQRD